MSKSRVAFLDYRKRKSPPSFQNPKGDFKRRKSPFSFRRMEESFLIPRHRGTLLLRFKRRKSPLLFRRVKESLFVPKDWVSILHCKGQNSHPPFRRIEWFLFMPKSRVAFLDYRKLKSPASFQNPKGGSIFPHSQGSRKPPPFPYPPWRTVWFPFISTDVRGLLIPKDATTLLRFTGRKSLPFFKE